MNSTMTTMPASTSKTRSSSCCATSLRASRQKSGNQGLTQHSQLVTKAINARNHGAKAVVVVNGKLGDGEEDLLTRFGSVSGPENVGIVMVQVKNAIARILVHSRPEIS